MRKLKLVLEIFIKIITNIIKNGLPYLVALDSEKVVGIAYLNKFREKSGYRFAFENTIYVHNEIMLERELDQNY